MTITRLLYLTKRWRLKLILLKKIRLTAEHAEGREIFSFEMVFY